MVFSWIDFTNLTVGIAGLTITVLGLLGTLIYRPLDRTTRQFFILVFSLLIVYTGSIFVFQAADFLLFPSIKKPSVFLESLSSALIMPVLTAYMLHLSGESWRKSRLFTAVAVLLAVYVVMLVYTQFSSTIYTVDSNGVYQRGPWYPVLLVPIALIMALNLWGLVRRWGKLNKKQRAALLVYMLVPLICTLIQMLFYGLLTIAVGTVLAALVMFVVLLKDQQESFIRQTEENARKEFGIRILQMRPHFIYNTLTSIYCLCRQDAKKAQQAILDFTTYLRRNFTAIVKEEPVPFAEELEHTRAYLAVEQARFQDRLLVEFEISVTMFRLPPLTLQPIVENAVKHGLDPELEPLFISVSTRQTEDSFEIVVDDSGPGYTPADDDEPHIALANIRERLKIMCGGELTISGRDCGGTVVTIRIPADTAGV